MRHSTRWRSGCRGGHQGISAARLSVIHRREFQVMSRRVLVTGASRGIGRAIAYQLAVDGFAVSVHCRTGRSEAEAVTAGIAAQGGSARVLQFDVRDRATCREMLEADVAAPGPEYGIGG